MSILEDKFLDNRIFSSFYSNRIFLLVLIFFTFLLSSSVLSANVISSDSIIIEPSSISDSTINSSTIDSSNVTNSLVEYSSLYNANISNSTLFMADVESNLLLSGLFEIEGCNNTYYGPIKLSHIENCQNPSNLGYFESVGTKRNPQTFTLNYHGSSGYVVYLNPSNFMDCFGEMKDDGSFDDVANDGIYSINCEINSSNHNGLFSYSAQVNDLFNNSFEVIGTITLDNNSPVIENLDPSQTDFNTNENSQIISFNTSEYAICKYDYSNIDYEQMNYYFLGEEYYHNSNINLNSGENNIYIKCQDEVGNQGTVNYQIYYDDINPSIFISNLNSGETISDIQKIDFNLGSGLEQTTSILYVDEDEISVSDISYNLNTTNYQDGPHILKISAQDEFGVVYNSKEYIINFKNNYDQIMIYEPNNNSYQNSIFEIKAYVSTDVKEVNFSSDNCGLNNSYNTKYTDNDETDGFSVLVNTSQCGQGIAQISASTGSQGDVVFLNIDSQEPEFSFNSYRSKTNAIAKYNLSLASDTKILQTEICYDSSCKFYQEYFIDGCQNEECDFLIDINLYNYNSATYTINFTTIDFAGNTFYDSKQVTLDNNKPILETINPNQNSVLREEQRFDLSFDKSLDKFKYRIDSGVYNFVEVSSKEVSFTINTSEYIDGFHVIDIVVNDTYSNTEELSMIYYFENAPKDLFLISPLSRRFNQDFDLVFYAPERTNYIEINDDCSCGVTYTKDSNWIYGLSFNNCEETCQINVSAYDLEDNLLSNYKTNFTLDDIAPLVENSMSDIVGKYPIINPNVNSDVYILNYFLVINSEEYYLTSITNASFNYKANINGFPNVNAYLKLVAYDYLGNVYINNSNIFSIDTFAPKLSSITPARSSIISEIQEFELTMIEESEIDSFIYRIDNEPYQNLNHKESNVWNFTINTNNFDDGTHLISIFVNDTLGNENEFFLSYNIENFEKPFHLIYPTKTSFNDDFTLYYYGSENINYVNFSDTNCSEINIHKDQGLYFNVSLPTTIEEYCYINASAYDADNNFIDNYYQEFYLDNVLPTLDFNVSDIISGTSEINISTNAQTLRMYVDYGSGYFYYSEFLANEKLYFDSNNFKDGNIDIKIIAYDEVSNKKIFEETNKVIDNTAPDISITSPSSDSTIDLEATIEFDIIETNDIVSKKIRINGVEHDINLDNDNYTWDTSSLNEGKYFVEIVAIDSAGNIGRSETLLYNVFHDSVGKHIGITNPLRNQVIGSDFQIRTYSSDSVAYVNFTAGTCSDFDLTDNIKEDGFSSDVNVSSCSEDQNEIKVDAYDFENNLLGTYSINITIDLSVGTFSYAGIDSVVSNALIIQITNYDDDVSNFDYYLYDVINEINYFIERSTSDSLLIDTRLFADSTYQIKTIAYDSLGNNEEIASANFDIDNTAPNLDLEFESYVFQDIVRINFSANDAHLNTSSYELMVDNVWYQTQGTNDYYNLNSSNMSDGVHILKGRVSDVVGNVKETSLYSIYVDNILDSYNINFLTPDENEEIGLNDVIKVLGSSNIYKVDFSGSCDGGSTLSFNPSSDTTINDGFSTMLTNLNLYDNCTITAEGYDENSISRVTKELNITFDSEINPISINYNQNYSNILRFNLTGDSDINLLNIEYYFNNKWTSLVSQNIVSDIIKDIDYFSDGVYNFRFTYYDNQGNVHTQTIENILLDSNPPEISINNLYSGQKLNDEFTFNYDISDYSSIHDTFFIFNNNTQALLNTKGSNQEKTINTSQYPDGIYSIKICSKDALNNYGCSQEKIVEFLNTISNFDFYLPYEYYVGGIVNFTYLVSGYANVIKLNISNCDTLYTDEEPGDGWNITVNTSLCEEGESEFRAELYYDDTLLATTTKRYFIDNTEPSMTLGNIKNYYSGINSLSVQTDDDASYATLHLKDNSTDETFFVDRIYFPARFTIDSNLVTDGDYKFVFRVYDIAGNENYQESSSFFVDNSAPELNYITPESGSAISGVRNINISFDEEIGVNNSIISLDGKNYEEMQKINNTYFSHEIDTTSFSDGIHTIRIKAYDYAGNEFDSNLISYRFSNSLEGSLYFVAPSYGGYYTDETDVILLTLGEISEVHFNVTDCSDSITPIDDTSSDGFTAIWDVDNCYPDGSGVVSIIATGFSQGSDEAITQVSQENLHVDNEVPNFNFPQITKAGILSITPEDVPEDVQRIIYQYAIDGGSSWNTFAVSTLEPWTVTLNTENLAKQNNNLLVKGIAYDIVENEGIVTTNEIDYIAPEISITQPLAGVIERFNTTINYIGSDVGTGIDSVEVSIDGNSWSQINSEDVIDLTSYTDGLHYIQLRANDSFSNYGYSQQRYITIDNTPQPVTIINPSHNTFLSQTTEVLVIAPTDTASVEFISDCGFSLEEDYDYSDGWRSNFLTDDCPSSGEYSITTIAKDSAENEISRDTINVTVDTDLPDFTIQPLDDYLSDSFEINITDYSEDIVLMSYQYSKDGSNWVTYRNVYNDNSSSWNIIFDTLGLEDCTEYEIRISAQDLAGNIVSKNSEPFKVNNIAPNIFITSPNPGSEVNSEVQIDYDVELQCSDLTVSNLSLLVDGEEFYYSNSCTSGCNINWNSDNHIDGAHYIQLKVEDSARNDGLSNQKLVYIDNSPTPVKILRPYSNDLINTQTQITMDSPDDTYYLNFSLTSGCGILSSNQDLDYSDGWSVLFTPNNEVDDTCNFEVEAYDFQDNFIDTDDINLDVDTISPDINININNDDIINSYYEIVFSNIPNDYYSNKLFYETNNQNFSLTNLYNQERYMIDTSSLPDGDYILYYNASDDAGNSRLKQVTFEIDNTAPIISYDGEEISNLYEGDIELNLNVTDNNSIDSVLISIDGNTYQTMTSDDSCGVDCTKYFFIWDSTNYPDGAHTYKFKAIDELGNQIETITYLLYVDNTPEPITIIRPENNSIQKGIFNVYAIGTDDTKTVNFTTDCGSPSSFYDADASDGWTFNINSNSILDSNCNVVARAYDSQNRLIDIDNISLIIDNEIPQIETSFDDFYVYQDSKYYVNDIRKISVDSLSNDVNKLVFSYRLGSNEYEFFELDNKTSTFDEFYFQSNLLDDGIYTLRTYAYDKASNVNYSDISIEVDNTHPQTSFVEPIDSVVLNGISYIKINSQDNGVGINSSRYILEIDNNSFNVDYDSILSSPGYEWNTSEYRDGIHRLKIISYDLLGNSVENEIYVYTDNTPSSTKITYPNNNSLLKGNFSVNVFSSEETKKIVFDNNCSLSFKADNNEDKVAPFSTILYASSYTGLCKINVTSYNHLDEKIADDEIIVRLDNTPDEFTIMPISNVSNLFVVSLDIDDDLTDIKTVEYHISNDGTNFNPIFYYEYNGNKNVNFNSNDFDDGNYVVKVKSIDFAGNSYEQISNEFIIDNTPPQISITEPDENSVVNGLLDIEYLVTDSLQDIDNVMISIDGSDYIDINSQCGSACHRINTSLYSYGAHSIKLKANDTLSNIGYSLEKIIFVDNSIKPVRILLPYNNSIHSSNFEILVDVPQDTYHVEFEMGCLGNPIEYVDDNSNDGFNFIPDISSCFDSETTTETITATAYTINSGEISDSIKVRLDNQLTVNFDQPSIKSRVGNEYINGVYTLSLTSVPNDLEKVVYEISSDTINWAKIGEIYETWNYNFNTNTYSDGTYYMRIIAKDFAGNEYIYPNSGDYENRDFIIDNSAPIVTWNVQEGNQISGTYNLDYILSDIGISQIDEVLLSVDGSSYSTTCTETRCVIDTTTLYDGMHDFSIRVNDTLGNTNYDYILQYVDNTQSSTQILNDKLFLNENELIRVFTSEDTKNVTFNLTGCEFLENSNSFYTDYDGSDGFEATIDVENCEDGTYELEIISYNILNEFIDDDSYQFIVDRTIGKAEFKQINRSGIINLSLTNVDADSIYANIYYSFDNVTFYYTQTIYPESDWSMFFDSNNIYDTWGEENIIFKAIVKDRLLNENETYSNYVDVEAPQVTWSINPGIYISDNFTLKYSISDLGVADIDSVWLSVDGNQNFIECNLTNCTVDTTNYYDGTHTFTLYVNDTFANVDDRYILLIIDNTPSAIKILNDEGKFRTNQYIEVLAPDYVSYINFSLSGCTFAQNSMSVYTDVDALDSFNSIIDIENCADGNYLLTAKAYTIMDELVDTDTYNFSVDRSISGLDFDLPSYIKGSYLIDLENIETDVTHVDYYYNYSNELYHLNTIYSPFDYLLDSENIPDGDVEIKVIAYDDSQNNISITRSSIIDNTKPILSIDTPDSLMVLRDVVDVNFTISDNYEINTSSYKYRIDNFEWNEFTEESYELNTSIYSDGSHKLEIFAKDIAGNEVIEDLMLIFDNTPSPIQIIKPWDNSAVYGLVDIELISPDNTKTVELYFIDNSTSNKYDLEFNQDQSSWDNSADDGWNFVWNTSLFENDELYELIVIAYDELDRYLANDTLPFIETDNKIPDKVENLSVDPQLSNVKTITLNWSDVADNDIEEYAIYRSNVDNFTAGRTYLIAYTDENNFQDVVPEDGTYYYRISAIDNVGHEGPASETNYTVVDTEIIVGILSVEPEYVKNGDTFKLYYSSEELGLDVKVNLSNLDSTFEGLITLTDEDANGVYEAEYQVSILNQELDGEKILPAMITDGAVNFAQVNTSIFLDNTDPTGRLYVNENDTYATSDLVSLSLIYDDNIQVDNCRYTNFNPLDLTLFMRFDTSYIGDNNELPINEVGDFYNGKFGGSLYLNDTMSVPRFEEYGVDSSTLLIHEFDDIEPNSLRCEEINSNNLNIVNGISNNASTSNININAHCNSMNNINEESGSIMFWTKLLSDDDFCFIDFYNNSNPELNNIKICYESNQLNYYFSDGLQTHILQETTTLKIGDWHFIALTWDEEDFYGYLDSKQIGFINIDNQLTLDKLSIGNNSNLVIDHMKIVSNKLNEDEVNRIYLDNFGFDEISYSFWFKINSTNMNLIYISNENEEYFSINLEDSNLSIYNQNIDQNDELSSTVDLDEWNFISLVFNNSNYKIYFNSNKTIEGNLNFFEPTKLSFGPNFYIDDFKVERTLKNDEEIFYDYDFGERYVWESCSPQRVWKYPLGEGLKTTFVQIKDMVGNKKLLEDSIIMDTIAPEINITFPLKASLIGGMVNTTYLGTENSPEVSIDGGLWEPADSLNWTLWNTSDYENGAHTIQIRDTDLAGNVGYSERLLVYVDNQAPFGRFIVDPIYVHDGSDVNLKFESFEIDLNVSVDVSLLDSKKTIIQLHDLIDNAVYENSFKVSIDNIREDGEKLLELTSVDQYGNELVTYSSIFLDNENPEINFTINNRGLTGFTQINPDYTSTSAVTLESIFFDNIGYDTCRYLSTTIFNPFENIEELDYNDVNYSDISFEYGFDGLAINLANSNMSYDLTKYNLNQFSIINYFYFNSTSNQKILNLDSNDSNIEMFLENSNLTFSFCDVDLNCDNESVNIQKEDWNLISILKYNDLILIYLENELVFQKSFEFNSFDSLYFEKGNYLLDDLKIYDQVFTQSELKNIQTISKETCKNNREWLLTYEDGLKTVYAQIIDKAGNSNIAKDTINLNKEGYYLDLTPPSNPEFSLDEWYNTNESFDFNWEESYDRESELLHIPIIYYYRLLNESGSVLIDWKNTILTQGFFDNLNLENNKTYFIEIYAQNSAYLNSSVVVENFSIDLIGPKSEIDSVFNQDDWYINNSLSFNFSAHDNESGVCGYSYTLNKDENSSSRAYSTNENEVSFPLYSDGIYWMHVSAYDCVGNYGPDEKYRVKVDFTPPQRPFMLTTRQVVSSSKLTFSWLESEDDLSGLDYYELHISSSDEAINEVYTTTDTNYTIVVDPEFVNNQTEVYAWVRAYDNAGLYSTASDQKETIVDFTAPIITYISSNGDIFSHELLFAIETDDVSTCYYDNGTMNNFLFTNSTHHEVILNFNETLENAVIDIVCENEAGLSTTQEVTFNFIDVLLVDNVYFTNKELLSNELTSFNIYVNSTNGPISNIPKSKFSIYFHDELDDSYVTYLNKYTLIDNSNGNYTINFEAPRAGNYTFGIEVGGKTFEKNISVKELFLTFDYDSSMISNVEHTENMISSSTQDYSVGFATESNATIDNNTFTLNSNDKTKGSYVFITRPNSNVLSKDNYMKSETFMDYGASFGYAFDKSKSYNTILELDQTSIDDLLTLVTGNYNLLIQNKGVDDNGNIILDVRLANDDELNEFYRSN